MMPYLYTKANHALSRMLRTPQYIILFVSDDCWVKCRHCWYSEDWKSRNLKENRLSFQELERLADSISSINFLSLTGGEAFLREDIVDICNLFAQRTKLNRYEIPTSGYNTDLIISATEKLLDSNRNIPFRVDVSLDGTEETHDMIRNVKGSYKNALNTIEHLNRLKQHYSYFDVGIITTISKYNQNEIRDIADIVDKISSEGEWMVNITRGKPRDPASVQVDPNKYFEAHRLIEQRIINGKYRGHSGHFLASWLSAKNAVRRKIIKDILNGNCRGGGCAAGTLGAVIFNDGAVYPCEMIDQSLGNLKDFDYSLPELWKAPQAGKIRSWIQETECLCTQECFLSISLLIQPQYWPDMIHERIKLLLAKIKTR